jgi:hypothetical protein
MATPRTTSNGQRRPRRRVFSVPPVRSPSSRSIQVTARTTTSAINPDMRARGKFWAM